MWSSPVVDPQLDAQNSVDERRLVNDVAGLHIQCGSRGERTQGDQEGHHVNVPVLA